MNEETPSIQFAPTSVTIQPGEQTTEHAMAELHNLHASLIKLCGSVAGTLTAFMDVLGYCPENKFVLRAMMIIGFALAAISHISHTLVTMNYTDARSLIKATVANTPRPGPSISSLILLALLLSLPLSNACAVEFEGVKAQGQDAVHVQGTVNMPPKAVDVEITANHNGEIHPGAVPINVRIPERAVEVTGKIDNSAPLIEAPVNVRVPEKAVMIEGHVAEHGIGHMEPNAVNIRLMDEPAAKALGNAMVAAATVLANTLHETNTNFSDASHKAEQDARYFGYAMGALLVAALVGWFFHVRWHKSQLKEARQ